MIIKKSVSFSFFLITVLFLTWSVPNIIAQNSEGVQIKTIQVRDNIYMLQRGGGNIVVSIGEDGNLLIDSKTPDMVDNIKSAVSDLNAGPIRFILNTNWHFDHADGNELFAKDGAIIIAHDNSRKHMLRESFLKEWDPNFKRPPYPKDALPVITVSDRLSLHVNGDEILAIHMPEAHSDGDLAFYFKNSNVIHTGDLFFSNGFPFINVSNGGTINGMIKTADKILDICDDNTILIPGHGPPSNREELKDFRDMMIKARDRIANLVEEGKTLEEVIEANPTADLYKGGKSMISTEIFIKVVYMDLTDQY